MAIKIRMARFGAKKKPFYSVVVTDSRSPRDSSYIERLGTHNPLLAKDDPKRTVLNLERIQHWMKIGAKPSDVVARFLRSAGVITTQPVYRSKRAPKKAKGEEGAAAAPAAAAPAAAPAAEAAPAA